MNFYPDKYTLNTVRDIISQQKSPAYAAGPCLDTKYYVLNTMY